MPRRVLFAKVPSFYCSVERLRHPELASRPLVVGGAAGKRGRVQAASEEAEAAGVEAGMLVSEALALSPEATALRTDMAHYRKLSIALRGLLRREVDALEPSGMDAAYLELAGVSLAEPELAARLRDRVRGELGLPLRVGVATGKLLARLAASHAPEGGIAVVEAGGEAAFLDPLPVAVLPGVGQRTVATLAGLGVATVGELREVRAADVELALGNHGLRIRALAGGDDEAPVRAERHPRTLSQSRTLERELVDLPELADELREIARGLEANLVRLELVARKVTLRVRYADASVQGRSTTLGHPVQGAEDIVAVVRTLLERTEAGTRPIDLVGIHLGALDPAEAHERQLELMFPQG